MIKLDIPQYCQNCIEFEPEITKRPYQVNSDCFGGGSCLYGDASTGGAVKPFIII